MQTKHFINDPANIVHDALKAATRTNPRTSLDAENKVIYNLHANHEQLALISGGGSGHEPAFTGFIGPGFLAASVAGTIFASPSSKQVLAALNYVTSSKGILVVVMNYTGDVLNFGVAVEKAKAADPTRAIEQLVVADDVGVPRTRAGRVGRRGIAGTVLVQKVLGAMSTMDYSLDETLKVGKIICNNLVSVGASLNRVHVPGRSIEASTDAYLEADEVELGMGIHNEPGSARISGEDAELKPLVAEMLRQLLDKNDLERNFLPDQKDEMVLLINNLGSISTLELGAVANEVIEQLEQTYQKKLVRIYYGTMMTSLDGPGFSISLLNVMDLSLPVSLLQLLDAACDVPGWQAVSLPEKLITNRVSSPLSRTVNTQSQKKFEVKLSCNLDESVSRLSSGLRSVIRAEPEITSYDDIVGDGDCGTTLKRGAQGILDMLSTSKPSDIVSLVEQSTSVIENTMDGTSGALFSIFFNALTVYFKRHAASSDFVDTTFWTRAVASALDALNKYTSARQGDRTIMDALIPFADALKTNGSLEQASKAAADGATSTKDLRPKLGRTVYVGEEQKWLGKIPDPGAWGLGKFFEGLACG